MPIDDTELARRSILGFGEMLAILGRTGVGTAMAIRRADALGARMPAAADNPWFDAVVVPPGVAPPADDPALPLCVWATAAAVPGRAAAGHLAMPVMGIALAALADAPAITVIAPSLAEVGVMNARAYGMTGYADVFAAIADDRIAAHGVAVEGQLACVAVTLAIGDDIAIHYVATEAAHRRQGLASRLLVAVMAAARDRGARTATLQASPDGLSVYKALGFRRVALLRGFLRSA